jgi:hypothetical protein
MRKGIIARIIIYGLLACIISVGGLAWLYQTIVERAYFEAVLSSEIDEIVMCGSIIKLLEENREGTAIQILEYRLKESVNGAYELQKIGIRMYPGAYPNLRKGLVDVTESSRQKGKIELADRVESILHSIDES